MILTITLKIKRVMTMAIWAVIKESMTMRMTTSFSTENVDKDDMTVQDEDEGDYGDVAYAEDKDGDDAFLYNKKTRCLSVSVAQVV